MKEYSSSSNFQSKHERTVKLLDKISTPHISVTTSATETQNGHHYLEPSVTLNQLLKTGRIPTFCRNL